MKNLFLFLTVIILFSCSKDDSSSGEFDKLPAATQIGANTGGCLVNGIALLPRNNEDISSPNCFYQLSENEYYFSINFPVYGNEGFKAVVIKTKKITLQAGQTYILNQNMDLVGNNVNAGGEYVLAQNNKFYTNDLKKGELKITHLDMQNLTISGTFWFDAINFEGETIQIRNGRFDSVYIQ
jgi:hypothetical protein